MANYRVGSKVKVTSDNECYDAFRDKILVVTHVARSQGREEGQHPGYDSDAGGLLMDFKTTDGEDVPCSLYDWEVKRA